MGIQERKEREKELRKLQILVAAKRVFFDKGLGHTTMEDIAQKAELSSGTLYNYFKNKDELYASMTLRVLQYLVIRIEQLHREFDMDEVGKIKNLKSALLDVYKFDPQILRFLFLLRSSESRKQLSLEMVDEISELERQALNSIADVFRQAIMKGICLDLDPTAIADIVWSLFSGVVMLEFSKRDVGRQQDHLCLELELAFEIFEKGIRVNLHRAVAPQVDGCSTDEAALSAARG